MNNSVVAEQNSECFLAPHRSENATSTPSKSSVSFTNSLKGAKKPRTKSNPQHFTCEGVAPETNNRTAELMAAHTALSKEIELRERIEALLLKAQEELQEAIALANIASSAKSAFLANMSHEIRTPLGAVLGLSELLLTQDQAPSERVKIVEAIKLNGQRLLMVIDDILDLSRVEAGNLAVEKVEVPLEDILADLRSFLSFKAAGKGLHVDWTIESPLPNQIMTDAARLRQILGKIIGNAVKFTDKGSITVKIKQIRKEDGKRLLGFEVKDTGRGISAEHTTLLFEPFSQADSSTTRRFGGTGLGLVISRSLAQALGGNVEILQSTLGKGSSFVISIDPGDVTWVNHNHIASQGTKPERSPSNLSLDKLKDLKFLLVEDAPENRLLFTCILQAAGVEVDIAVDGREGVEKALQGKYDLVLMDLQMPVLDGYAATRELRRAGFQRPIVALTAHALKEERQRCLAAGFSGHLSKPISRNAFLQSLVGFYNESIVSGVDVNAH